MFNPSIMTEHGGRLLDLPRAAVLPLHALSDFDEVWQFPDAMSMVAAMRANYAATRPLTTARGSHG
jgi:hypothetical protein